LPLGETVMDGVQHGIDAVGFQARDRDHPDTELPTQVIDDLTRLVNPTGHLGVAGVYAERDLHPAPRSSADGALTVPWASLFAKGVSVGFGRTHDRRYTTKLRDLIVTGRARPGRIVTHHGSLAEAPALFDAFDRREQGVVKAVLHPGARPHSFASASSIVSSAVGSASSRSSEIGKPLRTDWPNTPS
jgi:glutathione-independent formaldehyde dehydrogenase